MPAITSNHVNYLVWRYLQEEGLALSAYTLDREAHASQWAPEFAGQTGDGELVKLVLKGLQMREIEQARLPPELLASSQVQPVNLEPLHAREPAAKLQGGHATAFPSAAAGAALVVAGPGGAAAYSVPGLELLASGAFAAAETPTCIESRPESESNDSIFLGYDNGAVRQWALQNGGTELLGVFMLRDADHAPITALRRAPAGQLLASIDVRNVLAVWDTATRTLAARIDLGGADTGLLADAVWITDSMLAALQPDSVAVYTVGEAAPRKLFHAPRVAQVAFDSVSRLLASGSDDGQVCLWSSHSDEPYSTMREHQGPITHVGWVADAPVVQPQLLTASTDGWLKLWTLGNAAPAAAADAAAPVYAVQTSDLFIAALTKHGVIVYNRALKRVAEYTGDGVQSIALHGRTLAVAAKEETMMYTITIA